MKFCTLGTSALTPHLRKLHPSHSQRGPSNPTLRAVILALAWCWPEVKPAHYAVKSLPFPHYFDGFVSSTIFDLKPLLQVA